MKKILLSLFFVPAFAFAQKNFIIHKVEPKETLYSLARKYQLSPKEIATFNNIDINAGLVLGQDIKIPKAATVDQKPVAPAKAIPSSQPVKTVGINENGTPIYHTVEAKETLYSISVKYGKIPIDKLRKWNNISPEGGISQGQKLIVGYNDQVPPTGLQNVQEPTPATNANALEDLERQKAELARQQKMLEEKEKALKAKEDEAKKVAALEAKQRKDSDQKTIDQIAMAKDVASVATPAKTSGKFNGGVFKSAYTGSLGIEKNGTAGVFKSTSGWEDGKYYCLHNSAPIGSIIKITNAANGVAVFAKVLDVIPNLKQNQDVLVRLTNSAAAELGMGEENFAATVSY